MQFALRCPFKSSRGILLYQVVLIVWARKPARGLLHTLRLSGGTQLIFMTAVKEGKQLSGAYEIPRLVQKGYRQLDVE